MNNNKESWKIGLYIKYMIEIGIFNEHQIIAFFLQHIHFFLPFVQNWIVSPAVSI